MSYDDYARQEAARQAQRQWDQQQEAARQAQRMADYQRDLQREQVRRDYHWHDDRRNDQRRADHREDDKRDEQRREAARRAEEERLRQQSQNIFGSFLGGMAIPRTDANASRTAGAPPPAPSKVLAIGKVILKAAAVAGAAGALLHWTKAQSEDEKKSGRPGGEP